MDGLTMCVHREHRTGNCRECHPIGVEVLEVKVVDLPPIVPALGEPEYWFDPLLWDGDNS